MSDLTERLRAVAWSTQNLKSQKMVQYYNPDGPEAAARIEALEAELERAREAMRGVITWDAARGFPIPYRVRDPIHACLVEGHPPTGGAE